MSESSSLQMEFYLNMAKSQAGVRSLSKFKIDIGMHFLSQIKKLKDGLTFDKIDEIKNLKLKQEDEQKIKKDIEFLKAKIENLLQKLLENKKEVLTAIRKNENSKSEIRMMKQSITKTRMMASLMDLKQANILSEVEDLKQFYNSK